MGVGEAQTVIIKDEPLASGETLSTEDILGRPMNVLGAYQILGAVTRKSTAYNVKAEYLDNNGDVLFTEDIVTAQGAGTTVNLSDNDNFVPVRAKKMNILIEDDGTGTGDVTATLHAI